jgi:hypothetical protein
VTFETGKNIYFSTYPPPTPIHLSHHFTSESNPAAQRNVCRVSAPSCEPLYMTNTSHRKQEIFLYECPLHWELFPVKKTHNRTLLFGSKVLKNGRHFDYWNQPLNMRMRVYYLDCHEASLCCYLVIHIENLLRQLQRSFSSICDLFTDFPRIFLNIIIN